VFYQFNCRLDWIRWLACFWLVFLAIEEVRFGQEIIRVNGTVFLPLLISQCLLCTIFAFCFSPHFRLGLNHKRRRCNTFHSLRDNSDGIATRNTWNQEIVFEARRLTTACRNWEPVHCCCTWLQQPTLKVPIRPRCCKCAYVHTWHVQYRVFHA